MRRAKKFIYVIIGALFVFSIAPIQEALSQESAGELYEAALFKKGAEGDLEGAIQLFNNIIVKFSDERNISAKAQLQIGMCYEKLGRQEAEKAYSTVISDYSEQEELVKAAKVRLTTLLKNTASIQAKTLSIKKVWEGTDVDFMGEPSPDGKYISYVDWETGDLAIYEIETGKKRRLTSTGSWDDPDEFALTSRWSPDGKQIIYDWYSDDNPSLVDLYIIGLDGTEPRKLWGDEELVWTQCFDWSPDGKQILACFEKKDQSIHIGLISASTGSVRFLKDLSGGADWSPWPKNMRFSSDSRMIAYDIPVDKENPTHDIRLLSTDGSIDVSLVKHPMDDYLLDWIPDNSGILFASDRKGTLSAWILNRKDGESFENPELVKQDIGLVVPVGFTRAGSYYFGIPKIMNNVYIADINLGKAQFISSVQKAIRYFEGFNQAPAFSPDGKYLAYISKRVPGIRLGDWSYGGNVLCIKSMETGKIREIKPSLNLFGFPIWSPDGSSIIVLHRPVVDDRELSQIDVQTGNATCFLNPDGDHVPVPGYQWSPSGKVFYYGLWDTNASRWSIIARDLDSGSDNIIYTSDESYIYSISPDGQWLALFSRSIEEAQILILSTAGGEPSELYRFKEGIDLGYVPSTTWTTDGKYILFGMRDPDVDDKIYELCRIPASGGEPEKLGLKMKSEFVNLNIHPDGRQFTFSTRDQHISQIWVMENFLPGK